MKKLIDSFPTLLVAALCSFLVLTQTAFAEPIRSAQDAQQPPAPVQVQTPQIQTPQAPAPPPQFTSSEGEAHTRLASAKRLFLENDGSDDTFPGAAGEVYNRFAADMQNWGRYTLVDNVAEADLVIKVRAATTTTVVSGTSDSPSASVYSNPYVQLTIADPASLTAIWVIATPIRNTNYKKLNPLAAAAQNSTSEIKQLSGTLLTPQEQSALVAYTNSPNHHWWAIPVITVGVAAAIVLPLVLFKVGVDNGKASQDAFCKANNIPLNECAGG